MNQLKQRRAVIKGLTASAILGPSMFVCAQSNWPDRPIRVIVPFPPGNTIDIAVRLLQTGMSARLGQPIIVENVVGAGGRIGTAATIKAKPDGYTIGAVQSGTIIVQPHTTKNLGYDVTKDLVRVALSVRNFNVLVTNNNVPFKTLPELISWAKANPGKLTYGSNGEGGFPHLWFEDLAKRAGITFTHVPYKGATQIATDLISGQIMAAGDGVSAMSPFIKANQLTLLNVTNLTRVSQFPNVPTVSETVPNFVANGDFGFAAPANTPSEIIKKLNAAINGAVEAPEVVERLPGLGLVGIAQSPEYFEAIFKREYTRFGEIVKSVGYQPK
jgi:tripartite-type tricarboxylate transporter receptor subunit TctC